MSTHSTQPKRTFRSDNNAGVCPEATRALIDANNTGHAIGYGDDQLTKEAVRAFQHIFTPDIHVFLVATGTIANTLAVASLTEPWQRILCHRHSHWNDDESTAPERFTGCRTTAIDSPNSKLTPADVKAAASCARGDVHQPQPGVLTISNATEFGEVYSPDETRALCQTAHELGYRVHVDGARFANAVAHLNCDPRALTIDAGVDALSFGGTKNGLALGEAVIFFAQSDGVICERAAQVFPFHRKGAGALLSKHRFVAAPFAATLQNQVWLTHAAHANAMASKLSQGLAHIGYEIRYKTQANAVFPVFSPTVRTALEAAGHEFYMFGDPSWNLARLMCSWDTNEEDVHAFLQDAAAAKRAE